MYLTLLPLHSLLRWLVLICLVASIICAYRGWLTKQRFSRFANFLRIMTVNVLQIQFCIGLGLYFLSPLVSYFLNNFKTGIHMREIRFFGMEHITMMVIAVGVISVGSGKINKMTDDRLKYKTMAIWFTVALLIIFSSIPWSFSPLTSRPNFRPF
ncbi:hypothetical protein [Pedobacter frigoris]|uniref:Uncharacterized protein n=1 Tax=Pedobacter frigoris TaxID=2571272 RepID=A0A4U1CV15_9SPHI|nr:hypothetical protein [Pedobacter frigoris]TKC09648.1 hypothetical protein FA047_06080 [Pedobacter frigoris]